jgi:putative membrane protein
LTGAHYTYAKVPFGFYLSEIFDISRNHFDRIVHFSFGLLLTYPIRELLIRYAKLRGFFSYYLPVDVVLACSGFFEIIEWILVLGVNPELGDAYLGTQGDIWDAQKDMTLATIGSVVAMLITFTSEKIRK